MVYQKNLCNIPKLKVICYSIVLVKMSHSHVIFFFKTDSITIFVNFEINYSWQNLCSWQKLFLKTNSSRPSLHSRKRHIWHFNVPCDVFTTTMIYIGIHTSKICRLHYLNHNIEFCKYSQFIFKWWIHNAQTYHKIACKVFMKLALLLHQHYIAMTISNLVDVWCFHWTRAHLLWTIAHFVCDMVIVVSNILHVSPCYGLYHGSLYYLLSPLLL